MPDNAFAWIKSVGAVAAKDLVTEFRSRYAVGSLGLFALMTLSSVSMSLGGIVLPPEFAAALLWVVLLFSAMAGLSRTFVQEQETGTLFTLRLYGGAQAVLFGKMTFNWLLLAVLTALVAPLFILFLNIDVASPAQLILLLLLGNIGIGTVATLTAAMLCCTRGQGALFTVLSFPILLPQFLGVIAATAKVLTGGAPGGAELFFLAGYDVVVVIAASILFDYLWQE